MVHALSHKTWTLSLAVIFLLSTACAVWTQQFLLVAIPFLLMAAGFLISRPHYLLYVLLISIPWSVEFNITPQLGTDLPDEPLMWFMSLLVLMMLIYQHKTFVFQRVHPIFFVLALQLVWLILTVITSSDILLSVKYLAAKCWYLLAFVAAPFLLFTNTTVLKRAVVLLLFSMLVFMFVTLARHAQLGLSFSTVNDALAPFYRNHVNYSALLVFMVPIQIALLQLLPSKKLKFALSCILAVTIGALYFSYSRGAWLALFTGLTAFWLIRKRLLLFSFVTIIVISIASILYLGSNDRYIRFSNDKSTIFHTDFREHLIATYKLKDMSNGERVYRWVAGIKMIRDFWMTGSGPSTFYSQYKNYTVPSFRTYVSKNEERSTVHNYFLLVFIEQGVIGLLLFLLLVGVLFWYMQNIYHRTNDRFWKVCLAATATVLVMVCTVNFLSDMIETDKVGSVFYLCVAVVVVADRKTSTVNRES